MPSNIGDHEARRASFAWERAREELGFPDGNIVSLEFTGSSARARLRANVYRAGDHYRWSDET